MQACVASSQALEAQSPSWSHFLPLSQGGQMPPQSTSVHEAATQSRVALHTLPPMQTFDTIGTTFWSTALPHCPSLQLGRRHTGSMMPQSQSLTHARPPQE